MFLGYIKIFPDFFYNLGKRLDMTAMVNFKIGNFAGWETDNYHTQIGQFF